MFSQIFRLQTANRRFSLKMTLFYNSILSITLPNFYESDGGCYGIWIISRGFEPFAGPTMPRASISSTKRAALL